MSSNDTYRLPIRAAQIDRGPMSKVAITGPLTEHDVMRTMYGEGAVSLQPTPEHIKGCYMDTTPMAEHERLVRRFGMDSESNQSWVERTYGPPRSGGLEAVMRSEHNPDLRGPVEGGEAPEPMDANAKQVPAAIDPDDGGAQAALEGRPMPTDKDGLRAELEELGCVFKSRDTNEDLTAMIHNARAIMALGGGVARGSDAEALAEQLATAQAAAESGEDDDAQAALNASVAENAA